PDCAALPPPDCAALPPPDCAALHPGLYSSHPQGVQRNRAPDGAQRNPGAGAQTQTNTLVPARGPQRFSTPSRPLTVEISRLNELSDEYNPKNRPSTPATRYMPLPAKRSSSSSTLTSTPRQKPPATSPPARPTTRRLATSRTPSISERVSGESAKS